MELVQFCNRNNIFFIRLVGDLEFKSSAGLETILGWIKENKTIKRLVIDLSYVHTIDSTNLGMIAQLGLFAHQKHEHMPILSPGAASQVKQILSQFELHKLFRWKGDDEIFGVSDNAFIQLLEPIAEEEVNICERAIQAHRALVSLGEGNREFNRVIAGLQIERALIAHEDDIDSLGEDTAVNNHCHELKDLEVNRPYVRAQVRSQRDFH